jgi:hypothetical protein
MAVVRSTSYWYKIVATKGLKIENVQDYYLKFVTREKIKLKKASYQTSKILNQPYTSFHEKSKLNSRIHGTDKILCLAIAHLHSIE